MKIELTLRFIDLPQNPKWNKNCEPNPEEKYPGLSTQEIFARKVWELIAEDMELETCRIKSEIEDLMVCCFIEDEELIF